MLNRWLTCSSNDNYRDFSSEDSPVNFQMLAQLDEIVGHEVQQILIQQFLEYAPQQVDILQKLLVQGDTEALRCKAHQFKGECSQLGARHLAELCKELEIFAKTHQLDLATTCLTQCDQEIKRVNQVLMQVCHHDPS